MKKTCAATPAQPTTLTVLQGTHTYNSIDGQSWAIRIEVLVSSTASSKKETQRKQSGKSKSVKYQSSRRVFLSCPLRHQTGGR